MQLLQTSGYYLTCFIVFRWLGFVFQPWKRWSQSFPSEGLLVRPMLSTKTRTKIKTTGKRRCCSHWKLKWGGSDLFFHLIVFFFLFFLLPDSLRTPGHFRGVLVVLRKVFKWIPRNTPWTRILRKTCYADWTQCPINPVSSRSIAVPSPFRHIPMIWIGYESHIPKRLESFKQKTTCMIFLSLACFWIENHHHSIYQTSISTR